jgi:hypothetical protein
VSIVFEYEARLVPVEQVTEILAPREGFIRERFDAFTFAGELRHPERVEVSLNHDDRDHGRLTRLEAKGGWWQCKFRLDDDLAVKVGTPVSIEFTPIRPRFFDDHRFYQLARLDAVSILQRGRSSYSGAHVTAMHRIIAQPTRRTACKTGAPPEWIEVLPPSMRLLKGWRSHESEIIGGPVIHRSFGTVLGSR